MVHIGGESVVPGSTDRLLEVRTRSGKPIALIFLASIAASYPVRGQLSGEASQQPGAWQYGGFVDVAYLLTSMTPRTIFSAPVGQRSV